GNLRFIGHPARMIRAIAILILTQVLLVGARAEVSIPLAHARLQWTDAPTSRSTFGRHRGQGIRRLALREIHAHQICVSCRSTAYLPPWLRSGRPARGIKSHFVASVFDSPISLIRGRPIDTEIALHEPASSNNPSLPPAVICDSQSQFHSRKSLGSSTPRAASGSKRAPVATPPPEPVASSSSDAVSSGTERDCAPFLRNKLLSVGNSAVVSRVKSVPISASCARNAAVFSSWYSEGGPSQDVIAP